MLAIGRALMSRPRLLDAGRAVARPRAADRAADLRRRSATLNRQDGLTVLIVEQNANHALKLAHRGYVMVNGLITLSGTGEELAARGRKSARPIWKGMDDIDAAALREQTPFLQVLFVTCVLGGGCALARRPRNRAGVAACLDRRRRHGAAGAGRAVPALRAVPGTAAASP